MAELIKQWNDGENLTVTYTGSGNGEATFTSEVNEGIDKEINVIVRTTEGNNVDEKSVVVKQAGLREEYITADDEVYMTADNEIYGCLK